MIENKKQKERLAKEYRKTTPNQMYGDELGFIAGYEAAQERIKNILEKEKEALSEKIDLFIGLDFKEEEIRIKLLKELLDEQ